MYSVCTINPVTIRDCDLLGVEGYSPGECDDVSDQWLGSIFNDPYILLERSGNSRSIMDVTAKVFVDPALVYNYQQIYINFSPWLFKFRQ